MTEPYYADESVTLYLGDCLEIDEWLAADVLVTDPPYGIAWTRNGMSRVSHSDKMAKRFHSARYVTGNPMNNEGIKSDANTDARDAALTLWAAAKKPAFVFGSLLLAPPTGTRQVAVYVKPLDSGNMTSVGGVRRNVEAIYLLGSHSFGGGGRSAVFQTRVRSAGGGGDKKNPSGLSKRHGHPHAKPGDVLEELIELTGGVVADPFAGSGSTLVAAKALGRKAIGVELEERYCEIAARRLAQDVLDFGEPA